VGSDPRWPNAASKGALDHLGLALVRLVVGVDERRFQVAVPHPLLETPHGDFSARRDPGPKGVAEIVKPHDAHASAPTGALEALADLRAVERPPRRGIREDEVVVGLERRRLEQALKAAADRTATKTVSCPRYRLRLDPRATASDEALALCARSGSPGSYCDHR